MNFQFEFLHVHINPLAKFVMITMTFKSHDVTIFIYHVILIVTCHFIGLL
jgi:hypothetical protein